MTSDQRDFLWIAGLTVAIFVTVWVGEKVTNWFQGHKQRDPSKKRK